LAGPRPAPVAAKIALPIAGARACSLVRAIRLALSRPGFLFAARGHHRGIPGLVRADVAASCLGECLGGVGEGVAGGDRNLKLPVLHREFDWTDFLGVAAPQPSGQFPAVPHPSASHISGKDRGGAAGLAHVVSPIAKRRPDRKSSRWPELRSGEELANTPVVKARRCLTTSRASSRRPIWA
jgi:hypothetical protein